MEERNIEQMEAELAKAGITRKQRRAMKKELLQKIKAERPKLTDLIENKGYSGVCAWEEIYLSRGWVNQSFASHRKCRGCHAAHKDRKCMCPNHANDGDVIIEPTE